MPKSEREEVLSALTSKIFSAMLDDIIMDAALQSHHEVSRSRTVCHVCNTHCSMAHAPGPSNLATVAPPSRPPSPPLEVKAANGSLGTGTSTPTSVKADGNIYFECLICSQKIASSRYAPHLSGCMGIGRRGAARGAYVKPKNSSESGRSPSPSDLGNVSDDNRNPKGKGKSKSKRADEAEFNLKRKRLESPQSSPNKKQKNTRTSGSAVTRVKSDSDVQGISSNSHPPTTASQSKVPSKLRDSSTASFIDRNQSSVSRDSSPVASMSTPTSSGFSVHSPAFVSGGTKEKKRKGRPAAGTGPPKRPSPPRPPPPPIQPPEADYNVDVEANETGSDTDIESP